MKIPNLSKSILMGPYFQIFWPCTCVSLNRLSTNWYLSIWWAMSNILLFEIKEAWNYFHNSSYYSYSFFFTGHLHTAVLLQYFHLQRDLVYRSRFKTQYLGEVPRRSVRSRGPHKRDVSKSQQVIMKDIRQGAVLM